MTPWPLAVAKDLLTTRLRDDTDRRIHVRRRKTTIEGVALAQAGYDYQLGVSLLAASQMNEMTA